MSEKLWEFCTKKHKETLNPQPGIVCRRLPGNILDCQLLSDSPHLHHRQQSRHLDRQRWASRRYWMCQTSTAQLTVLNISIYKQHYWTVSMWQDFGIRVGEVRTHPFLLNENFPGRLKKIKNCTSFNSDWTKSQILIKLSRFLSFHTFSTSSCCREWWAIWPTLSGGSVNCKDNTSLCCK